MADNAPWRNDPVAPPVTPWAADPAAPQPIDLTRPPAEMPVDNLAWYRSRYGEPAEGVDFGTIRRQEDPAGAQAWDNYAAGVLPDYGNTAGWDEQGFDTNNSPVDWARQLGQGLFGLGDELEGAIGGIGGLIGGEGFQPAYDRTVTNARGEIAEFENANPTAATALEIGGAVPTMFLPGMAAAARGVTTAGRVARGAAAGAATGAATGFGLAEGSPSERLPGALQGAVPGVVAGGLLPLAAPTVARVLTGRSGGSALTGLVPESAETTAQRSMLARNATTEDWRQTGQAAYRAADEAGVAVGPKAYNDFVTGIDAAIQNEPGGLLHQALTPRSWAVYDELYSLAGREQYTIQDLDVIRRLANAAATSVDRTDARTGRIIRDQLDEWFETLPADAIIAGNHSEAVAALQEARDAWGRYRRSEILDQAQERAEDAVGRNYTQAGLQTALRQQFAAIKRSRQFNLFTLEERAAINDIVRGAPMENALRRLGTFAPRGFFSNVFALGGVMSMDPLMMGATAVGEVARRASGAMTENSVARLGDLVRRTGTTPARPSFGTQSATLGALMAGQAYAGPRYVPEEWTDMLPVPEWLR